MNVTQPANMTAASLAPLNNATLPLNGTAVNNATFVPPTSFLPPIPAHPIVSHCPVEVSLDGTCHVPLHHNAFDAHGNAMVETLVLPANHSPESYFDLEPCNDDDPDQVQVALLSHQEYRRHVGLADGDHSDAGHDRAASPTTAMLLGCTRTLRGGRTAYKVDPTFQHRHLGRATYANYVQKRSLPKQEALIHDAERAEEMENELAAIDEAEHRPYETEEFADEDYEMADPSGELFDEHYGYETMSDPGLGKHLYHDAYEHARAAHMVEQQRARYLQRLEHDDFMQRWTHGDEHPRGPIDVLPREHVAGLHKRDLQHVALNNDDVAWETRSVGTDNSHLNRPGRANAAATAGATAVRQPRTVAAAAQAGPRRRSEDDVVDVLWETRSVGTDHGRGNVRQARGGNPGIRNALRGQQRAGARLSKRDLGDDSEGALHTRAVNGANGEDEEAEPMLMKRGKHSRKWRGRKHRQNRWRHHHHHHHH